MHAAVRACVCHTLSITRSVSLHLQYLFYESNLEATVLRSMAIANHMDRVRNNIICITIHVHTYTDMYNVLTYILVSVSKKAFL